MLKYAGTLPARPLFLLAAALLIIILALFVLELLYVLIKQLLSSLSTNLQEAGTIQLND